MVEQDLNEGITGVGEPTRNKDNKKKKKEEPKALSFPQICDLYLNAFSGEFPDYDPPEKLMCVLKSGTPILLTVSDDATVTTATKESGYRAVNTFGLKYSYKLPELLLNPKQIRDVRDHLKACLPSVPDPKFLGFKSDPELCYNRASFDPEPEVVWDEAPLFDELFCRMSNREALVSYIGSLFFMESYQQQYVWIYGGGGDGKGALVRALLKLFKSGSYCGHPPKEGHHFWNSFVIDKRLCVFTDCDDTRFVTGGHFKSLSGGDYIDVEIKNGACYTAKPQCKFIFTSNERPNIDSQKADTRRIIFCEVAPRDRSREDDPDYETKLEAEIPVFVSLCINAYKATNPDHGPIQVNEELTKTLTDENEEEFEMFMDAFFVKVEIPENLKGHTKASILSFAISPTTLTLAIDLWNRVHSFKHNKRGVRKYLERKGTPRMLINFYTPGKEYPNSKGYFFLGLQPKFDISTRDGITGIRDSHEF